GDGGGGAAARHRHLPSGEDRRDRRRAAAHAAMRLEHLTDEDEDFWRGEFAQQHWIFGALKLSVTLPEFAGGAQDLCTVHFGYCLQPLHRNASDREALPRKLAYVLARGKPPLDFLELSGAGVRIPHCFPPGFTLGSVLRITLQEMKRLPLREES